jgi:hypothetical protein
LIVDHLAPEAAALGPAHVHAQQHVGPVLRLGAAGARVNRDDRVLPIQLARQHRPDFAVLDVFAERVERAIEIGRDVLALSRPVDEHAEILSLAAERGREVAVVFEPAAAL